MVGATLYAYQVCVNKFAQHSDLANMIKFVVGAKCWRIAIQNQNARHLSNVLQPIEKYDYYEDSCANVLQRQCEFKYGQMAVHATCTTHDNYSSG